MFVFVEFLDDICRYSLAGLHFHAAGLDRRDGTLKPSIGDVSNILKKAQDTLTSYLNSPLSPIVHCPPFSIVHHCQQSSIVIVAALGLQTIG